MQDSNITFTVKAVGVEEATAKMDALGATITRMTVNANGSVSASGKLSSTLDQQTGSTDKVANATNRASKSQEGYIFHIAKTTVLSALVNKAFLGITTAAGEAVKQVDLFNNFPATMATMGIATADSAKAFQVLKGYIAGVGGDLSKAITSVTRFTEITKNVQAATAEFVGVNNALIAGAAPAEVQKNALEQLTQAYSRGKPQLIEWRSLMVAMPLQLGLVAKAMNLPNANALGEALTKGKVSMQDFITKLTELSTGTGPIASQTAAKLQGIEFATNIMKNALTNGLAAIYQAIGRNNIVSFFTFLTQVIIVLSGWIVRLINLLISLFNIISGVFGGPQLAHFSGEAQGAADAIGTGATNADDMANGLGNAADNAAKINKSLASFDKMNVLPDKTSGKTKDSGAGGPGGLDPATAGALSDVFGKIGTKLPELSAAAKIFSGILAGILGTMILLKAIHWFNDTVDDVQKFGKNLDTLSTKLGNLAKDMKDTFKGIPKAPLDEKAAAQNGAKFGDNLLTGIISGLVNVAGKIYKVLIAPILFLLYDVLLAAAVEVGVALGVSLAVAIGIVILVVAAIAALIYVIYRNWNTIWGLINKVSQEAWQGIQKVWDGVTKFFVDLWQGVYNAFRVAWDAVVGVFNAVVGFFRKWGQIILEILLAPLIFFVAAVILFVTAVVALFKFIWDGIVIIFSVAVSFFSDIFNAAWQAIQVVWDVVVAYFKALWDGIVLIFTVVAKFFGQVFSDAWNAIVAVWNAVSSWFDTFVIQPVIVFFTPLTNFLSGVFSAAWDAIKKVWAAVSGFFGGVWSGITGVFGTVATFFSNAFQNAYNNIISVFSGLWNWFKVNVWDRIVSVFSSIGTTVGDAIGGAFKGIINLVLTGISGVINGFFHLLNGAIRIIKDSHLPGTGGLKEIPDITIPRLAKGGIVDRATMATIGENGREAVLPLENNTGWMDTLASKLKEVNGGGQPIQLVVQIGEDKIVSKVINLINEKTNMSGRNTIIV